MTEFIYVRHLRSNCIQTFHRPTRIANQCFTSSFGTKRMTQTAKRPMTTISSTIGVTNESFIVEKRRLYQRKFYVIIILFRIMVTQNDLRDRLHGRLQEIALELQLYGEDDEGLPNIYISGIFDNKKNALYHILGFLTNEKYLKYLSLWLSGPRWWQEFSQDKAL